VSAREPATRYQELSLQSHQQHKGDRYFRGVDHRKIVTATNEAIREE
jgi:hypothetical protein